MIINFLDHTIISWSFSIAYPVQVEKIGKYSKEWLRVYSHGGINFYISIPLITPSAREEERQFPALLLCDLSRTTSFFPVGVRAPSFFLWSPEHIIGCKRRPGQARIKKARQWHTTGRSRAVEAQVTPAHTSSGKCRNQPGIETQTMRAKAESRRHFSRRCHWYKYIYVSSTSHRPDVISQPNLAKLISPTRNIFLRQHRRLNFIDSPACGY